MRENNLLNGGESVMTEDSEKQAQISEEFLDSYIDSLTKSVEASDLPEQAKGASLKALSNKESKAIIAALFVSGVLMMPNKAHAASTDEIRKAVTESFQEIFQLILTSLFEELNKKVDKSSDETQAALGKMGDSINQVNQKHEEQRISNASMPAPDHCRSDEIGKLSTIKAAQSRSDIKKLNQSSLLDKIQSRFFDNKLTSAAKALFDKFGPSSGQHNQHLDPTLLSTNTSIRTSNEEKKVMGFINTLTLPFQDSPNIPRPSQSGQELTKDELILKSKLDSNLAKLKMAELPFFKSFAERRDNEGKSKIALMEAEVQRTYGDNGEGWRGELSSYADPTPLTEENAKLLAFQNKVGFESLLQEEMSTNVAAVSLMTLLEDPARKIELAKASEGVK